MILKRFFLSRHLLKSVFLAGLLFCLLTLPVPASLNSHYSSDFRKIPEPKRMTFSREDSETCVRIIKFLERYHYSKKPLDDTLSSEILDRYLSMLDPSRMLFTEQDINDLELVRYRLDNALAGGDMSTGYHLFNLYLERFRSQLIYSLATLDDWQNTLDFTRNEVIQIDRDNAPWPVSQDELHELWRKSLKNAILIQRHDEGSDSEAGTTLKKRYTARLNRLAQTEPSDTFSLFMNAVTMSFDPHTQYFPPRQSEDFDIQMSLSLEGIGAVLQSENEYTKVIRLIPAGPAEKSRLLMPGDRIIGVGQDNGEELQDIIGWRIDDVVKLIRGPKGSLVRLEIIPADKTGSQTTRIVTIKRDKVNLEDQSAQKSVKTVTVKGKKHTIGIIDIPAFYLDFKRFQSGEDDYRSTTRDVRRLIAELKEENIEGLVIDLRDNGGGALQEVNQLTGLFITKGPTVQIKSGDGRVSRLEDPDPDIVYNGPLIVMTNRMSASASEIFAGAIRDYNRGIIVGTQTFGKGTVQALQPIDEGQLKLTSAKFYRISGDSTQSRGIEPHIEFPNIYNTEETGESSLKGFLAWDSTDKARYHAYRSLDPLVGALKRHHEQRIEDNPGFIYLKDKYALSQSISAIGEWPLNLQQRLEKRNELDDQELAIENRYREVKGLKPAATMKELGEKRRAEAADTTRPDDDPLLVETEYIMADFIELADFHGIRW